MMYVSLVAYLRGPTRTQVRLVILMFHLAFVLDIDINVCLFSWPYCPEEIYHNRLSQSNSVETELMF